jgi:hypothetical protein
VEVDVDVEACAEGVGSGCGRLKQSTSASYSSRLLPLLRQIGGGAVGGVEWVGVDRQ